MCPSVRKSFVESLSLREKLVCNVLEVSSRPVKDSLVLASPAISSYRTNSAAAFVRKGK